MFYTKIDAPASARRWVNHGAAPVGWRLTPLPEHDVEDAQRLGAFARIPYTGEQASELLRPLEHLIAVVRPAGEKLIRRSYYAAQPNDTPWPDFCDAPPDEEWQRPLPANLIGKWRRL